MKMTNSTRYLELDIAKGLAVLFMILVHTQDSFATPELKETLLGGFIDVMGGVPAAPVFMFLMGAGVAFSSATPVKLAKRGGILILLAVALNLLRGGIPYSLAGLLLNDSARLSLGLAQTFFIDILFFAGLSMLVLAILRRFYAPLWLYPVLTILAGLLNIWLLENSHLNGPWWGSPFFGATSLAFFPLLSWVAYPLLGVVYGSFLKQSTNQSIFHWRACAFASVVVLIGIVLFRPELERELGYLGEYGYYHHRLLGNLFFSAMIMIWIAVFFWGMRFFSQRGVLYLEFMSVNVNALYIVHWIIIGWLVAFTRFKTDSELVLILLITLITTLSCFAVQRKIIPKFV